MVKLQAGDPGVRRLLARGGDPFTADSSTDGADPTTPRFIRAAHFEYSFAPAGSGAWWVRKELPNLYVPALEAGNPSVAEFLQANGMVPPTANHPGSGS